MKKHKILSQKRVDTLRADAFLSGVSKIFLFVIVLFFISNNTYAQRGIFQKYSGVLNSAQQHYLTSLELNPNADYQLITVDSDALLRGGMIAIDLQDGRKINLFPFEQSERLDGRVIWKGDNDKYEGSVKFIINGDKITGAIRIVDAYHRVMPLSGGLHVLIPKEAKEEKICPMHGQGEKGKTFKPERHQIKQEGKSAKHDDGNPEAILAAECKMRLLYAYTPAVAAASADIVSLIETDTDDFNDINSNSSVDFEVEIARIVEVTGYVEVNSQSLDPLGNGWQTPDNLIRFWDPSDGFMDNIDDLRDLYDADLCQLYVTQLAGWGGFAMDVNINSADGFCASFWNNGGFTITHEFGHLIGMWHDTGNSPGTVPYAYGHGYFNDNTIAGTNFRTVMSYSNNCSGSCGVIPNWSNPSINFGGNPTGTVATHDNARVARLRDAPISLFQTNQVDKVVFNNDTVDDEEVADVYGSTSVSSGGNTVIFQNGSTGTYRGGTRVTLLPGFNARSGSVFQASTEMACSNLNITGNEPPNSSELQAGTREDEISSLQKQAALINSAELSLNSYPNPFSETTTIEYTIAQKGQVDLVVYDMFGKTVRIIKQGLSMEAGTYQEDLSGDQLVPGTYHCILRSEGETRVHKIVLIE